MTSGRCADQIKTHRSKSMQECQGIQGQAQRLEFLKFWKFKACKDHQSGGLNTAVVICWDSAGSTTGVNQGSN